MTVRACFHHRLGANGGGGTRPVLDEEWRAEPILEPLAHQASEAVSSGTRWVWNYDAHRPHWIGLRRRNSGDNCGCDCCASKGQELAANGVHGVLLSFATTTATT